MVNTLPAEIENRELAEIFDLDTAYSTSVTTQHRPGQRHYDISKDQLEHLHSLFLLLAKNSRYATGECFYHLAKAGGI